MQTHPRKDRISNDDFDFDWDKVNPDGPEPLRNYVYGGTIVKTDVSATKDNKPMVKLEVRVTHEWGGEEGDLKRKIFDQLVMSQEGAFRAKQCSLSADVPMPTSKSEIQEFAAALLGQKVYFRTRQDTYKGRTNAKIDRYLTDMQCEEAAAALAAE